jgi:hypothetical protein
MKTQARMKTQDCPREPHILRAAVAGRDSLPEELRQHAEGCRSCRDALNIQDGLRQLARETHASRRLPEAGEIWWRAEIIRRWVTRETAARDAERPLLWSRALAFALAFLAPVSLLAFAPPLVAVLVGCALAPLTVFLGWLLLQRDA